MLLGLIILGVILLAASNGYFLVERDGLREQVKRNEIVIRSQEKSIKMLMDRLEEEKK